MSDYLAVAGVSAVLRSLLSTALGSGGPTTILGSGASITNSPPDLIETGPSEPAQLNVFLYNVSVNPALRNLDLPSNSSSGARRSNPPLAVNLHYLVTAYGGKAFDQEILLGFAMQVFHDTPVLNQQLIANALADLISVTPASEEAQLVAASTLPGQVEFLRITPEALSTEEIYRLWTAFQVSYRPTTSYLVSVVVIQRTDSFVSNQPVQSRVVTALPLASPVILAVTPAMAAVGDKIVVTGRNFIGDDPADTSVGFDNDPAAVVLDTVQPTFFWLKIPSTLQAGMHTLRVLRAVTFPPGTSKHTGFTSSAAPLQVLPTITDATPVAAKVGKVLTLNVVPSVGRTQDVVVFLGDSAVPVPVRKITDPAESGTVAVLVPADQPLGTVTLRIEVDGAQSRLTQDSNTASPTFGKWLPQVAVSA